MFPPPPAAALRTKLKVNIPNSPQLMLKNNSLGPVQCFQRSKVILFIFHHSTFPFISSRHHSHFCDKLQLFVREQTNKWHFVKIPNYSCLFVKRKTTGCLVWTDVVLIVMFSSSWMDYNHDMKCFQMQYYYLVVRASLQPAPCAICSSASSSSRRSLWSSRCPR